MNTFPMGGIKRGELIMLTAKSNGGKTMLNRKEICLCSICQEMLYEGDKLVDNKVFKSGELSYIELAHEACAPEWAEEDGK